MGECRSVWAAGTAAAVSALLLTTACDRPETGTVTSRTETGTTSAPSAETAERTDRSLVRVVNAIPGGKAIDIYAGDSAAFTNVAYKKVTPFRQMEPSAASFQIKASPEGEPIAENREAMADGGHYTIIAMPDEGGPDKRNLRVLNDDFAPVPGDKARLRLVNAIPGEDDLTLKLRGFDDELFSDVAFQREAGWKDVDPFVGTLVLLNGDGKEIARLSEMKVMGGKSFTLIATGRRNKADVITVTDDVKPAVE
ncbi:MAG: DUF4397 domain-containing protein [Gemmatimonadales bacterium]